VPKAAVYENRYTLSAKYEVRPANNFRFSTPTREAFLTKYMEKTQLSQRVAVTLHARHDLGTFASRKDVGHIGFYSAFPLTCTSHPILNNDIGMLLFF